MNLKAARNQLLTSGFSVLVFNVDLGFSCFVQFEILFFFDLSLRLNSNGREKQKFIEFLSPRQQRKKHVVIVVRFFFLIEGRRRREIKKTCSDGK